MLKYNAKFKYDFDDKHILECEKRIKNEFEVIEETINGRLLKKNDEYYFYDYDKIVKQHVLKGANY